MDFKYLFNRAYDISLFFCTSFYEWHAVQVFIHTTNACVLHELHRMPAITYSLKY